MTATAASIIAVPAMDPNATGAIVWWRLSGIVDHEKFLAAWQATGRDPEEVPLPPSPEAALRCAMREQTEKRRLARPLGSGKWLLVGEQVTADGENLNWQPELKVKVNAIGALEFDPADHPLAPTIRADYDRISRELSQADISSWLVEMAYKVRAVALRDTGGIYFAPRDVMTEWREVTDILKSVSAHCTFEVPALKSNEAVDAILDAVQQEAQAEAEKLEAALETDMGARGLTNRAERAEAMLGKVKSYEGLLGRRLDVMREKLEGLQAQLATAALAAGSDDV